MSIDSDAQIEAVMATPIETVSADATIREAAATMRDRDINSLFVPGADAGIVTSTDVLDALAEDRDPDDCTVADVMTAPVESVNTDVQVREAAAMMTTYGINHLPVRDQFGDYVGMVSSTDLKEVLADSSLDQ